MKKTNYNKILQFYFLFFRIILTPRRMVWSVPKHSFRQFEAGKNLSTFEFCETNTPSLPHTPDYARETYFLWN